MHPRRVYIQYANKIASELSAGKGVYIRTRRLRIASEFRKVPSETIERDSIYVYSLPPGEIFPGARAARANRLAFKISYVIGIYTNSPRELREVINY